MPNIAIAMGLKEEAEVIQQNIEYHLALGIYKIFIVELGSKDNSVEVLQQYENHPQVDVLYFDSDEAAISLIQLNVLRIYEHDDVDYIVHLDPDEFLVLGEGTTLEDVFSESPAACYYLPKYNVVPIKLFQRPLTQAVLQKLLRLYFFTEISQKELCYPSPSSKEDYQRWIRTVPTHKSMHNKEAYNVEVAGHKVFSPSLKKIMVPKNLCIAHLTITTFSRFERRLQSITEFVSRLDPTDKVSFYSWRIQSYAYTSGQTQEVYDSLFPSKSEFVQLQQQGSIKSIKNVVQEGGFWTPPLPLHLNHSYILNPLMAKGLNRVLAAHRTPKRIQER